MATRNLSLPKQVALAGGIDAWNARTDEQKSLRNMLDAMCTATTVDEALGQVKPMIALGNFLWAYMYMRMLAHKNLDLCYATVLADPATLLPVMYTPTVGEACQVRPSPWTLNVHPLEGGFPERRRKCAGWDLRGYALGECSGGGGSLRCASRRWGHVFLGG